MTDKTRRLSLNILSTYYIRAVNDDMSLSGLAGYATMLTPGRNRPKLMLIFSQLVDNWASIFWKGKIQTTVHKLVSESVA